ncbi:serine phosphatase RsbU (regulator of sigma subunit) [Kitasatospora sp. SolWspMP-SS2h]|uniref:PP2C family protein-serine/threonine phosphatase n=1 Tax=Kitasatospora sp. SolWspMP-SS2h TaxID=1305729 RepID=UPI000DBFAD36|nr:PP2C family protein-serine/threonine phosphatase [Kitasatospora sp. SolWspMP-SS2h]RAJ42377.1 serine phosphatase RsbU (regulator of sigma subunit) [Kitasatospora sp. SolWspMP-SS2h]
MPATGDGRAPDATSSAGTAERSRGRRAHSAQRTGQTAGPTAGQPPARNAGPAPIPHPRSTPGAAEPSRPAADFRVLVVEADGPEHTLFDSLAAELGQHAELHRVDGIREALAALPPLPGSGRRGPRGTDFQCVLLDLGEPATTGTSADPGPGSASGPGTGTDGAPAPGGFAEDFVPGFADGLPDGFAEGVGPAAGADDRLDGLRELLLRAPHTAVVVLTDAAGAELGAAAVAAGAQDFLLRQDTGGPLLARALRYAVERKRADESQRRLVEAEIRGQENARLQRHLLPTPLLDGANLSFTRRYRPGRRRALLGGDFYDAVRTKDGRVHVVIGDVCGHGPDEAALGVALRIAWRTLVFAGLTGQPLLTTLQHVLEHERRSDEIFATLCMVVLDAPTADGGPETAELYLAGHPAPLLLDPDGPPVLLPLDQAGPALGLLPCDATHSVWPALQVELPPGWRLLMYTDGLVEGKVGAGSPRLGQEGLIELIADHQAAGLTRGRLVDSAIAEVEELNGGALTDDVAVLLLERNPVPVIMG